MRHLSEVGIAFLIYVALLLLIVSFAHAEPTEGQVSVLCEKTPIVVEAIRKNFDAKPAFVGQSENKKILYIVFTNAKDHSFVIVFSTKTTTCLLGAGEGSVEKIPVSLP